MNLCLIPGDVPWEAVEAVVGLSHHDLDYVVVTVAVVDILHSGDGPLFL